MNTIAYRARIEFGILLIVACLYSCDRDSGGHKNQTKPQIQPAKTKTEAAVEIRTEIVPKAIQRLDSATILGEKYIALFMGNGTFCILDERKDTLVSDNELCPAFEFEDFDRDGHADIRFHYMSNVPAIQDLFLFDRQCKTFKKVAGFTSYPAPLKIGNSKYYYSYHRSGCADMSWDSDLFFIDNYTTVRIGNISGEGCGDLGIKDAIYIHMVKGEKERLIKTLPIETISKYDDGKWGFIKEYWRNNYIRFI